MLLRTGALRKSAQVFGLVAALSLLSACGEEAEEETTLNDALTANADSEISTSCLQNIPAPTMTGAGPARLSLNFENFRYSFEDDRHRYSHDRRFRESAGVGLFIYRGKVCVENATVCADACVRYRVDAGSSLTQNGHHVATPSQADRITLQYWARDDAGNLMTFTEELLTEGTNVTVKPPQ